MALFNKNWIGFDGNPITGRVPPRLIVNGPPLNEQQNGAVNHAFKLFCDAVNVSAFPKGFHVQNRKFPDGTTIRMESNQGVKRVLARTPGAEDVENAYVYVSFVGAYDISALNDEKSTHIFRVNVLTGKVKAIAQFKSNFYEHRSLSRVGSALFVLKTFGGTNFLLERNRVAINAFNGGVQNLPTGMTSFVPGAGYLMGFNVDVGDLPYPNPVRYAQLTQSTFELERTFTLPASHITHPDSVAITTPVTSDLIVSNAHKNHVLTRPRTWSYPFAIYDYMNEVVVSTYNPPSVYASGPTALSDKFVAIVEEVNNGWLRVGVYQRSDWQQVGDYIEIPPTNTTATGEVIPGQYSSVWILLEKYVVVQRGISYTSGTYKRKSAPKTYTFRIGKGGLKKVVEFDAFTSKLPQSEKFFAQTSMDL